MTDKDMLKVVAEAAVALDDAKERIKQLEAELKDAERRIQFLEKMLAN